jgi:hypothetical protein
MRACGLLSMYRNITQLAIIPLEPDDINRVLYLMLNDKPSPLSDLIPLWPNLRTLAASLFNKELLHTVILTRKMVGYPLARLCVGSLETEWSRYQEHIDKVVQWTSWGNLFVQ